MFNEEQKQAFMNDRKDMENKRIALWFNRLEPIEKKLKKDLSEFTKDEILKALKDIHSPSWKYIKNVIYYLRAYANWCEEKGLLSNNEYNLVVPSDVQNCVDKEKLGFSFVRRRDILEWINKGFIINPRDQFCFLCLFEGIRGVNYEEIVNLTCFDIREKNGKYLFDVKHEENNKLITRTVEVSEELWKIANEAYRTLEYKTTGSLRSKTYRLEESERIFKPYINASEDSKEVQKGRAVYRAVKRNIDLIKGYYNNDDMITRPSDVFYSGILYKLKNEARKNEMDTVEFLQCCDLSEIEEQFNIKIQVSEYMHRFMDYLD